MWTFVAAVPPNSWFLVFTFATLQGQGEEEIDNYKKTNKKNKTPSLYT